jgi:hypothetical protein
MATRSLPRFLLALVGFSIWGCGGATTKAPTAVSESPAPVTAKSDESEQPAAKQDAASDEKVPTKCAKNDPCQPPAKWVNSLCHDVYPALALYLFQQGMPWEKRYLTTRRTEARNASGGATLEGYVEFDEELLVLKVRKADLGGMQVSGAGESYDVLRWNGSCVSLSGEELTARAPSSPKAADVNWRILDDSIQEAMKEDAAIRDTARDWRKECKGAASGEVSKACEKLGKKMSDLVVKYVRNGGKVPLPGKLP